MKHKKRGKLSQKTALSAERQIKERKLHKLSISPILRFKSGDSTPQIFSRTTHQSIQEALDVCFDERLKREESLHKRFNQNAWWRLLNKFSEDRWGRRKQPKRRRT